MAGTSVIGRCKANAVRIGNGSFARRSFQEGWELLESTVFYYARSNLWLSLAKPHGDLTIEGHLRRRAGRRIVVCAVRGCFFCHNPARLQETLMILIPRRVSATILAVLVLFAPLFVSAPLRSSFYPLRSGPRLRHSLRARIRSTPGSSTALLTTSRFRPSGTKDWSCTHTAIRSSAVVLRLRIRRA